MVLNLEGWGLQVFLSGETSEGLLHHYIVLSSDMTGVREISPCIHGLP